VRACTPLPLDHFLAESSFCCLLDLVGVFLVAGHHHGVDYWALGILIYEMLSGYSPFADHVEASQVTIYKNIIAGKYSFPSFLTDNTAKDLVRKLLVAKDTKVCFASASSAPSRSAGGKHSRGMRVHAVASCARLSPCVCMCVCVFACVCVCLRVCG
jgi:serine/threonine protein kinase